jgi:hypothetical protein
VRRARTVPHARLDMAGALLDAAGALLDVPDSRSTS